MKKFTCVTLLAMSLLVFTSCGKNEQEGKQSISLTQNLVEAQNKMSSYGLHFGVDNVNPTLYGCYGYSLSACKGMIDSLQAYIEATRVLYGPDTEMSEAVRKRLYQAESCLETLLIHYQKNGYRCKPL